MTSTFCRKLSILAIVTLAAVVLIAQDRPVTGAAVQAAPPAAAAQAAPPAPAAQAAAPMPAAKPQDVDSIDHIIAAVYDVISGPAGQARDWNRFKSLFIPEARLIPNGVRPDGTTTHRVMSPLDYAELAKVAVTQQGFFENEVARKQEQYGNIVHVFSTYESRREKGAQPFARGINSFQLLNDGKRWYVVTIMWQGEDPAHPLPAQYLKSGS